MSKVKISQLKEGDYFKESLNGEQNYYRLIEKKTKISMQIEDVVDGQNYIVFDSRKVTPVTKTEAINQNKQIQ